MTLPSCDRPATYVLPVEPTTPRAARRELAKMVADHQRSDDFLLCASEVVTNAVLHSDTESIVVSVCHTGRALRLTVSDGSTVPPLRREAEPEAITGRGLQLLDTLASHWGYDVQEDGKTVWFELDDPVAQDTASPQAASPILGADEGTSHDRTYMTPRSETLAATEDLDLEGASRFEAMIDAAIERGAQDIVIDLASCQFVDSIGVNLLVTTALSMRGSGGSMTVVNPVRSVQRTLQMCGLFDLLTGSS